MYHVQHVLKMHRHGSCLFCSPVVLKLNGYSYQRHARSSLEPRKQTHVVACAVHQSSKHVGTSSQANVDDLIASVVEDVRLMS